MNEQRMFSCYIISFISFLMIVLFTIQFNQAKEAAMKGFVIWWEILFPALFPFFVVSELLVGLGIVYFFGCLLDPVMKPIFKVPGAGGFVMFIGFISGYPVGARMTMQIWQQGALNHHQAERLLAFSTTADPIFLIGAVCIGFFQDASLAWVLIIAHYSGALLVGICLRFFRHDTRDTSSKPLTVDSMSQQASLPKNIWIRAIEAMYQARLQDQRTFSLMLLEAIKQACRLIMVIGGLVVLFSVLLDIVNQVQVFDFLRVLIHPVLNLLHIPLTYTNALLYGLCEVTNGIKEVAHVATDDSLKIKVAIAAFMVSWAGFSVHTQIMSMVSAMQVRYRFFALTRWCHGIFAACIALLIWGPLQPYRHTFTTFFTVDRQMTLQTGLSWMEAILIWQKGICILLLVIFIWLLGMQMKFAKTK